MFSVIFMIFQSRLPKTDCINGYTKSKLWENSLFDFYSTINVSRNNSQDTFKCMENQGKIMKDTIYFYFDDLPVKLT